MTQLLFDELRRWYFPRDLLELRIIKNHIDTIGDTRVRNFANVCFSEILRRSSRADSSYANLMINKKAKPKHKVFEYFQRQLSLASQRLSDFTHFCNLEFPPEVICGDARNLGFIPDCSFEMVISHPPYLAAVPYAEFMRLSLLWFGIDPKKIETQLMAGKRRRKDIVDRFTGDMVKVFNEMFRMLRHSGKCCVVIGNPESHGKIVQLNGILREQGESAGFDFEAEIARKRINMRKGKLRNEYILIFSK